MALILHTTALAQVAEYGVTGGGGGGWGEWEVVTITKSSFAEFFQQMCPDDSRSTKLYGLSRIETERLLLP